MENLIAPNLGLNLIFLVSCSSFIQITWQGKSAWYNCPRSNPKVELQASLTLIGRWSKKLSLV